MTEIPLKVFVTRSKEVTVHRFRGAFDFDGLHSVVSHLYGSSSRRMVIEYIDEDGDKIRVSSDVEWKECCRLHEEHGSGPAAALKIYVRKVEGKRKGEKRDSACKADSGTESDSDAASPPPAPKSPVRPAVPKLAVPSVEESPLKSLPPVCPAKPKPENAMECVAEGDRTVLELLSLLFKCDAAHELMCPVPAVDFGSCVRRAVNPHLGEVHLDIDRTTLRHRAIVLACAMMDENQLEAAATILSKAGVLFPQDAIIDYNLACACALQGQTDRAVFHLESAVTHGYDRVAHLETDPDLASILGDERVKAILAKLRGEPVEETPAAPAPEPASEPETTAMPEPEAAPVAARAIDANVLALMNIFPHVTEAEAAEVLAANRGNVHMAVNVLLTRV